MGALFDACCGFTAAAVEPLGFRLYNWPLMQRSPLPLTLIAHNIRSAHNVGALFRTGDGAGIEKLILTGISPYPLAPQDTRLPHVAARATRLIAKTALGAEATVPCQYQADISAAIQALKRRGYRIYALEQQAGSTDLFRFKPRFPAAVVVGAEVAGLDQLVLSQADEVLEIPMLGHKESLNVSVAAGVGLYRFSHYWLTQANNLY
ncbi:TrmH family RNA methyltransferase [Candidatus Parcubacteria bacterium]|nr:TrmH family RNA methyltransferase [Candidatus Parcubacteria bacterium]